ncbi:MAG: hypothetical protein LBF68_00835 [Christensenellaceae bacterium]|jgi:hypothetical protein|nr:hypothetical protein [Christensenellaceae bacterium]
MIIKKTQPKCKKASIPITIDGIYYESEAKYSFNDVLSIVKKVMGDDDYLDQINRKPLTDLQSYSRYFLHP